MRTNSEKFKWRFPTRNLSAKSERWQLSLLQLNNEIMHQAEIENRATKSLTTLKVNVNDILNLHKEVPVLMFVSEEDNDKPKTDHFQDNQHKTANDEEQHDNYRPK